MSKLLTFKDGLISQGLLFRNHTDTFWAPILLNTQKSELLRSTLSISGFIFGQGSTFRGCQVVTRKYSPEEERVSRNRYFNDQKRRQPDLNRNLIWGAKNRRPYRHKRAHSPFFWRLVRRAHGEFNQRGDSRSLPGQQQAVCGLQVDLNATNATAGSAATALLEQLRLSKRRRKQQAGCSLSHNEPTPTTTPIGVFCPPKHPANGQVRLTCMRARGEGGFWSAQETVGSGSLPRGDTFHPTGGSPLCCCALYNNE